MGSRMTLRSWTGGHICEVDLPEHSETNEVVISVGDHMFLAIDASGAYTWDENGEYTQIWRPVEHPSEPAGGPTGQWRHVLEKAITETTPMWNRDGTYGWPS